MSLPSSGEIKVSQINTELDRTSNTANSSLAGGTTPQTGSLFKLGQAGGINQTPPHAMSEWHGYPFVSPCTLVITSTQTTNPTNAQGNNGTASISFQGGTGTVTYTLNGVSQSGTFQGSPLNISNLSQNTTYTVVITDTNNCSATTTFALGETSFQFTANYIMITYEFTSPGQDLDVRAGITDPIVGQRQEFVFGYPVENDYSDYLGFGGGGVTATDVPFNRTSGGQQAAPYISHWPNVSYAYLIWGGDNTATGFESILIDVDEFKSAYPNASSLTVDLRAWWYGTSTTNPVNVEAVLWDGGAPVKASTTGNGQFIWENPTATSSFTIDSVGKTITAQGGSAQYGDSNAQTVATFTYNLDLGEGLLS